MKENTLIVILSALILFACGSKKQDKPTIDNTPTFQNKGHELVYEMVNKVGDYQKLADKKNVEYTYTYVTPDGKTDTSTERYIFDGELSYGQYAKHERTLPQLEGVIEQGYDGKDFWLKHEGQLLTDTTLLKRVAFNRPTNFYWFAMMQKLLDPGLHYEYLGEKTVNNKGYEIVKVTFDSTDGKPKDIYQVYINKETSLIDFFLFTVVDFDIMEPFIMTMEYEAIEGILIPTKRKYKKSDWEAVVTDKPWVEVTWSDIKFNTPITKDDFKS